MKIVFCLSDNTRIHIIKPFIELLLKKDLKLVLCYCPNNFSYQTYNLKNINDLNLILKNKYKKIQNKDKHKKGFLNLSISYYYPFKGLFFHYLYLLLKYLKLSKIIDSLVSKKFNKIENKVFNNKLIQDSNVIFSLSDRNLWIDLVLAKFSSNKDIKLIVPYLTSIVNPLMLYKKSKYFISLRRKSYYPAYIYNYIKEKYKLDPDNSFTMGKLFEAYICCNDNYMQNKFLSYGLKKEKLPIVGDLNFLRIKNIYKQKKEYILLSVPDFYEHEMMQRYAHFKELENLISKLILSKFELVLSLSPRANQSEYMYLENKFKLKIINNFNFYELLPNSKYLISTFSSVINVALSFKKKVLVFDHYFYLSRTLDLEISDDIYLIKNYKDYNNFSIKNFEFEANIQNSRNNLNSFNNLKAKKETIFKNYWELIS